MLKIKLLTQTSKAPIRASEKAAGYDLHSAIKTVIAPKSRFLVDTGIAIAINNDTYARIAPRSGLAVKGIDVGAGVIDSDYRGAVKVLLINTTENEFKVEIGDRIAQLIITRIETPIVEVVDDLDATVRGEGGFGSTGC